MLVIFFLSAVPFCAETRYPSQKDIRASVKDIDYALRRFEETTGKINFARWDTSHARIESSRRFLDATLSDIRNAKGWIADLESSDRASSPSLFRAYEIISDVGTAADALACDVRQFTGDHILPTELEDTSTLAVKTATKFRPFLFQQLKAQEEELSMYRSASQPRR